jgi:hypothetical protein
MAKTNEDKFNDMKDVCVKIVIDSLITNGFKGIKSSMHQVYDIMVQWYIDNVQSKKEK